MTAVHDLEETDRPRQPLLHPRRVGLVFGGNLVSVFGNVVHGFVTAWLIYRLTHSSALVGSLGLAASLSYVLLAMPAGILADHRDRRRFLLQIQVCMMLVALAVTLLVWGGHGTTPVLVGTTIAMGLAGALAGPVWLSFLGSLFEDDEMMRGYSLASITSHVATALGPLLGALLLGLIGAVGAFAFNTASFLLIIGALLVAPRATVATPAFEGIGQSLAEILAFARGSQKTRVLLPMSCAFALLVIGLPAVMPAYAANVLHGSVGSYGILMAAFGAGTFTGAVVLGILSARAAKRHLMVGGGIVAASGVITLAAASTTAVAVAGGFAVGAGQLVLLVVARTVLQMDAPAHLHGRLLSLFIAPVIGLGGLGGFALGWAADRFGMTATIRGAALYAAVLAVALATGALLRSGPVTRLSALSEVVA